MATFTTTFSGEASFKALIDGHEDKGGPVRQFTCNCYFEGEAAWITLRNGLSFGVEVIPMPWGSTVDVVYKGGAGLGTLVFLGGIYPLSYQAYLIEAVKTEVVRPNGPCKARATWLLVS
jgi:hypothetical protein